MTQSAVQPVPPPPAPQEPRIKRLGHFFWRAMIGAAVGGVLGLFLVSGGQISGAAIGAVLGWYLARGLWGAVAGAVGGWFLISGTSGVAAGMVVGIMITCNIVGSKGRWIVLAVVVVLTAVSIFTHQTSRDYVLGLVESGWTHLRGTEK